MQIFGRDGAAQEDAVDSQVPTQEVLRQGQQTENPDDDSNDAREQKACAGPAVLSGEVYSDGA